MKRHKFRGTNGVPSLDGGESFSIATRIRARCDVVEALGASAVQPEVEEAERGLAL